MINFNFLFIYFFFCWGRVSVKSIICSRITGTWGIYTLLFFKFILMHLRRTMTTNCSGSHCSPRASMLDLHWNSSIKEENLVQYHIPTRERERASVATFMHFTVHFLVHLEEWATLKMNLQESKYRWIKKNCGNVNARMWR